ncbi:MAG: FAD-dependent oxidoreductase [Pseudomonadales bacterium]|nr:FAD-dependent oxidoreductase [Pseudomonadales bacterium]
MSQAYQKYICVICGYIYDEELGDPESGLPSGTLFADIPDEWECPDCGVTKQDFILLTAPEPEVANVSKTSGFDSVLTLKHVSKDAIVVLGGGMAAWEMISQLRKQDNDQAIIMITHCSGDVYSKPQLSTALNKQKEPNKLIQISAADQAATLGVTLLPYTRVLAIDSDHKRLILPTGGLQYNKLILALGANQKYIPFPGSDTKGIHRINDLEQYRSFREHLDVLDKAHVAILGSGLIGCEFADDLVSAGHDVSLIDLSETPLSHLLPTQLSGKLAEVFESKGVQIFGGTTISEVKSADAKLTVGLANGKTIKADFLISAVGLQPNIDLAKRSGIDTQRGILVDDRMQTSCEDIYAIGDCTEHIDTGGNKVLLPYIKPILKQAKVIAGQIAADDIHYECNTDVVVIKTPSLPLSVCPPPLKDDSGAWKLVESQGESMALAYYRAGQMTGFALSGSFTKKANDWFQQIKLAS